MKIGQYLAKIWVSGSGLLFLGHPVEGAQSQRVHISAKTEHTLWEGHTLLKTGLSAHRHTQTHTHTHHRHTKV